MTLSANNKTKNKHFCQMGVGTKHKKGDFLLDNFEYMTLSNLTLLRVMSAHSFKGKEVDSTLTS